MRFLLYNIRYGTGGRRYRLPSSGYLRNTGKNLARIIRFIRRVKADVVGLLEVDAGSYRSDRQNQAELIAQSIRHHHTYRSKYGHDGMAGRLPLLCRQGNAMLSRLPIESQRFHYFRRGVKRLVMEMDVEGVTFFLVHLAISFGARHEQLDSLIRLVKRTEGPCIVAGDFNAMWGREELEHFVWATGLKSADKLGEPSFPSWKPRRHLDFVLHSPDIDVVQFRMPKVLLSDHLPLVCDFRVRGHVS